MVSYSQKKKISIVGDSFGCGEWQSNAVTHTGITQYLKAENFLVQNYSVGNANMENILAQITNNYVNRQTLIVFATDSLRHIEYNLFNNHYTKMYVNKRYTIADLHFKLFSDWIKELTDVTKKQKCEVILIGGHANLYPFDVPSNMVVSTNSWLTDIVNYPIGNLSGMHNSSIDTLLKLRTSKTDADKQGLVDIMTQKSSRINLLSKHKNFLDGKHPDRQCHKILSSKICKLLG